METAAARLLLHRDICGSEGSEYDFRRPRPIGTAKLDTAFTDLERDDDGRARVHLASRDGGVVTTIELRRLGLSDLHEIEEIRDKTAGFTGIVSDLGGPTANMYRLHCKDPAIESACRRLSCVFPDICPNMGTDHGPLIQLYRKARAVPGVKKVLIGSGVRYDLAVKSPEYVKELAGHHVGGYLQLPPEHPDARALAPTTWAAMTAQGAFHTIVGQ